MSNNKCTYMSCNLQWCHRPTLCKLLGTHSIYSLSWESDPRDATFKGDDQRKALFLKLISTWSWPGKTCSLNYHGDVTRLTPLWHVKLWLYEIYPSALPETCPDMCVELQLLQTQIKIYGHTKSTFRQFIWPMFDTLLQLEAFLLTSHQTSKLLLLLLSLAYTTFCLR